jgi:hypothetical protein
MAFFEDKTPLWYNFWRLSLKKQRSWNLRLVITLNKTLMKHIQNNQKSIGKSIPAYGFKKISRKIRKPNVLRLMPNVGDFLKENHTLGYGFKIYWKSIENL